MKKLSKDIESFWDSCAKIYDGAEMTNDNPFEMSELFTHLSSISGDSIKDIVTLGGATGVRDPKMILENKFNHHFKDLYFNDLSESMVCVAEECTLSKFRGEVNCNFLPGNIIDICSKIPSAPRVVYLGVYNYASFISPNVELGFPVSGINEYIKNQEILGHGFSITPFMATDGKRNFFLDEKQSFFIESEGKIDLATKWITGFEQDYNFSGLTIVSKRNERSFVSRWFVPNKVRVFLEIYFPQGKFKITSRYCGKATLFIIEPLSGLPRGIVTILNNVVGNILPSDLDSILESVRLLQGQ